QVDLVFIHGCAAPAHLLDEDEQWAAERHQLAERVTPQQRQRNLEERLGGRIGVHHLPVWCDHDHGMWQGIEYGIGRRAGQQGLDCAHCDKSTPTASAACGTRRQKKVKSCKSLEMACNENIPKGTVAAHELSGRTRSIEFIQ